MPSFNWPPVLKIVRHPITKAWWIHGDQSLGTNEWFGPYQTKQEAEDDIQGLTRTYAATRRWYEDNF